MTPFELGESRLPTISRRDSEVAMSKTVISRRDSDVFSYTRPTTSRRSSHSIKKEVPRDPASSQYYAELEHLRKVALVRLRHSARAVDVEWSVAKHESALSLSPKDDIAAKHNLKDQFEQWWIEIKRQIVMLDEQGKDLCAGVYFSLGWSDTPGLDHSNKILM
jgi:hypothetical protein